MGWYAFDAVETATEKTKDLLLPFDAGTWARLAILVIFTGSGMSSPNIPGGGYGDTGSDYGSNSDVAGTQVDNPELKKILDNTSVSAPTAAFSQGDTAAMAGIGVVVLLVVLFFLLISSVMSFVYYQSLIDGKVSIRKNFSKHLQNGVQYAIFIGLFFLIMALLIGGIIAGFITNPVIGISGLLLGILILLPAVVFAGLVNNFVLPETIKTDQNFWESMKTIINEIREQWKEVGVYILTRTGIKMLFGVVVFFFAAISFIVLLVPFGIMGALLYLLSPVLLAIPAILGIVSWIILLLGAQVVTTTYLNYYALSVHELLR